MTSKTKSLRRYGLRHSNVMVQLALGTALGLGQGAWAQSTTAAPVVAPDGPRLDIKTYIIDGDMPLSADEVRALVAPFTGDKRSLRDMEGAAAALEQAVRSRGYAFHRLFVPAQKPANGEVRLQVISFKVGAVEVTGNDNFSTDNIRRSLSGLKEGEVPQVKELGRDITATNANPAKQVSVTFKEARQSSTVDAIIKVRDLPPVSYYTTLSGNQSAGGNNGPHTNSTRLGFAYQNANLFDRDHVLTLSYTTSPAHISNVSLFGAYYQMPIYGTGMNLSAYITKSDVSSGRVPQGASFFDVSGGGEFMGVRLTRALARVNTLQQSVGVSIDQHVYRNSTTFAGLPLTPDVGARTLGLHYQVSDEFSWGEMGANLEYLNNIGGGPGNGAANYTANGAVRMWDAWRAGVSASTQAGGWQLTGRVKGQYASKALIVGEQFGLGGANSVRGFSDRAVTGDYGSQWNLEATGPAMSSLEIHPVVFIEGGRVRSRATGVTESIAGAGAGLRISNRKVQVSLDLAQVIDRNRAETSNPLRLHFSLTYRF